MTSKVEIFKNTISIPISFYAISNLGRKNPFLSKDSSGMSLHAFSLSRLNDFGIKKVHKEHHCTTKKVMQSIGIYYT